MDALLIKFLREMSLGLALAVAAVIMCILLPISYVLKLPFSLILKLKRRRHDSVYC